MIVDYIGYPRSATKAVLMFSSEVGIPCRMRKDHTPTRAQRICQLLPYDLDNFPGWVEDWLEYSELKNSNVTDYIKPDKHFINIAWSRSLVVYPMECKYPDLRFIIIHRNLIDAASSWFSIEKKYDGAIPNRGSKEYVEAHTLIYSFLIEQIKRMKRKPILFLFDKYIAGEYTDLLFELFGVPQTSANFEVAEKMLSRKINNKGSYDLVEVSKETLLKAEKIKEDLISISQDNWYMQGDLC
jgi:hypothetical protein